MNRYEAIQKERANFPALEHSAYLETAGTGLVPRYVYDATRAYEDARLCCGGDSVWGEERIGSIEMMDVAKRSLANMMHCDASEIVFGANTSEVLSYYTGTVRLRAGSNVVMAENTYTSGRYLWQMREKDGLEIRYAKVEDGMLQPEALFALADENTVAIHCDYVESSTGFLVDAARIGAFCRQHGIRFILDAAQALGVMPTDVQALQADLVAGNNYKWMLGYCGTGYGYINRAIWEDMEQRCAGWMSDQYRFYGDSPHILLRDDAGRFELGYPNMPGIYGLLLTAETYRRLGAEQIRQYVLDLRAYAEKKAAETAGVALRYAFPKENQSQILHLLVDPALQITKDSLRAAGVMCDVYAGAKEGMGIPVRIGLHYYNNTSDIDRFFAAVTAEKLCK